MDLSKYLEKIVEDKFVSLIRKTRSTKEKVYFPQ